MQYAAQSRIRVINERKHLFLRNKFRYLGSTACKQAQHNSNDKFHFLTSSFASVSIKHYYFAISPTTIFAKYVTSSKIVSNRKYSLLQNATIPDILDIHAQDPYFPKQYADVAKLRVNMLLRY